MNRIVCGLLAISLSLLAQDYRGRVQRVVTDTSDAAIAPGDHLRSTQMV